MSFIFLHPRRLFMTAILAATQLLPLYSAKAEMSAWAENEGGRMRLVALPPEPGGRIRAALQIEPKPGWITYWREPGNSGIPPQITIAPQSGATLQAIAYPVPKHFSDGKVDDIAYDGPVALPLSMMAKVDGAISIDATAFIGICKEICIPFQAQLSLQLAKAAQSRPEEEGILQAAAAALPEPPSADFSVTEYRLSPDRKQLSLELALPAAGAGTPEVIVTGPTGHVFVRQVSANRDGRSFAAKIAIGKLPKDYDVRGKRWGLLVIDGNRAMETTLAFE
ncbi:protein-disulfide reductase DsbD domain-containing protein [Rhizobium binxianense]